MMAPERLYNGSIMANITIKGIPEALHKRLKDEAHDNHRSLNAEIIHRLQVSVSVPRVDADAYLAGLDDLQATLDVPPLTDERLRRGRGEGRP